MLSSSPDHSDLLSSFLHNFRSKYHILTGFIPTQRCPTPSSIQRLKWCHTDTRMETVI
ncbi:hypothetical protein A2U01_0078068, partial [Trifolium medium]|nr:hypothetical protein [Trifolium medium]